MRPKRRAKPRGPALLFLFLQLSISDRTGTLGLCTSLPGFQIGAVSA
nr:MAG TPA: hypothetical protein [Caudoviricetes sp.]